MCRPHRNFVDTEFPVLFNGHRIKRFCAARQDPNRAPLKPQIHPNYPMKLSHRLSVWCAAALLAAAPLGAFAQNPPPAPAPADAPQPATPPPPPAEAPLLAIPPLPVPPPLAAPEPATAEAKVSLDQRVSILEAYLTNGDPSAVLKTAKNEKGDPDFPKGFDQAKDAPTSQNSGPGHNAWQMASAALVLFMTLPGLALFYGGLVRRKNVLSVLAQCFFITGLVTILWWAVGYSFAFSHGCAFLGDSAFAFFKGVDSKPNTDYSFWVSHNVYAIYQLMFAIITPALIIGAIAERMKFAAIMVFMFLWMFVVYFPLAHMVWGADGFMNGVWNPNATIKAMDFAGGTVVHMSSGWRDRKSVV